MSTYSVTTADADYDSNDDGRWNGYRPFLSVMLGSDIQTWPTYPTRASGTLLDRSKVNGSFAMKAGKSIITLNLVKLFGTDDYSGKGNGGEHRFKMRIQYSLGNLKLIEDIAGLEILAVTKANDGDLMLFGHKDFPAKIDRESIKGTKGELTGESGGRYIECDVVSFPYSAFIWSCTFTTQLWSQDI